MRGNTTETVVKKCSFVFVVCLVWSQVLNYVSSCLLMTVFQVSILHRLEYFSYMVYFQNTNYRLQTIGEFGQVLLHGKVNITLIF